MTVSYRAPCFACYPSTKELRLTLLGSERFYGRMLLALNPQASEPRARLRKYGVGFRVQVWAPSF